MALGVDRDDVRDPSVHIGVCGEHVAQVETHIGRRELGGGHLVEQGLELVVSAAVEQRHLHARLAREPFRGRHSAEAAANDKNSRDIGPHHRRGPPQPDADLWATSLPAVTSDVAESGIRAPGEGAGVGIG